MTATENQSPPEPAIVIINDIYAVSQALSQIIDADRHGTEVVIIDTAASVDVDPFVIGAAAAARTDFIRIALTIPVTAWQPYLIARRLAEIDKISRGRLAWIPLDNNDSRRSECELIVAGLLRSWPVDAVIGDRASGVHVDTERLQPMVFTGKYFSIDSPLDAPAGPQGVVPTTERQAPLAPARAAGR